MAKQSDHIIATDRELRSATAMGDRTDFRIKGAPGLQLRVTAAGAKTWALAYKSPATGKWAKKALGRFPDIGLAEAKGIAGDLASDVRKGTDPVHDRKQELLAESFRDLAKRYMREHASKNARAGRLSRTTKDAQRVLDHDILPLIGSIQSDVVSRQHVMRVVETIADRGSFVVADRALGLVRAIYNWACGTGRLDRNPTLGLKKRNTGRPRTRVLSGDELKAFWHAMEMARGMTPVMRDIYRIQLLTAARVGELVGTTRAELDLPRALWTIPAERTKAGREHQLPLSPLVVELFSAAIVKGDTDERRRAAEQRRAFVTPVWVFPSHLRPSHIQPLAPTRCMVKARADLESAGLAPFNTHDLRRTAATHLGEMGVADEIIERILNHAPRTVAGRHYNHARHLEPMRRALDAWAERLAAIVEERE